MTMAHSNRAYTSEPYAVSTILYINLTYSIHICISGIKKTKFRILVSQRKRPYTKLGMWRYGTREKRNSDKRGWQSCCVDGMEWTMDIDYETEQNARTHSSSVFWSDSIISDTWYNLCISFLRNRTTQFRRTNGGHRWQNVNFLSIWSFVFPFEYLNSVCVWERGRGLRTLKTTNIMNGIRRYDTRKYYRPYRTFCAVSIEYGEHICFKVIKVVVECFCPMYTVHGENRFRCEPRKDDELMTCARMARMSC